MPFFSHLTDDDLERYLMGQLPDEVQMEWAEKHMISCPECVERAKAMGEYIATVKEALRRDEQDGIHDPH